MGYVICDKCGKDEFIRILAIPIEQKTSQIYIEERRLQCAKCKDELTRDEVNKQLKK